MRAVRLVDVAERAGVSMKTVSNVVNEKPTVSPEIRERVRAAIAELGYRPNVAARRLATGRTGLIAVALPVFNVPYFAELAQHLETAAREAGLHIVAESTGGDPHREHEVLVERGTTFVDGIIAQPVSAATEQLLLDSPPSAPLVLLGEGAPPPTVDHVMIDNTTAARGATAHLLAQGSRRIAFLGAERGPLSPTNHVRITGYRAALAAAGLVPLLLPTDGYSARAGEEAVLRALAGGREFDGLLCRDDMMALGALRALHTAGVEVPGEVAVVGWDDIRTASFSCPRLTSVAPDKKRLADTALALLKSRIEGHQGPGRHEVCAHELRVRESSMRD